MSVDTDSRPRVVLMTSGLNPVACAFSSLPGKPVGIIEVLSGDPEPRWRSQLRRIVRKVQGRDYADLAGLCADQALHHSKACKRDSHGIHNLLQQWSADLVITCGCPLLSMECFSGLALGAINLHDALLPAYRGGNPLFWQVLDQVEEVGVSVHFIDAGMDTGSLLGQRSTLRPSAASRDYLRQLLEVELGIPLLQEVIYSLAEGSARPVQQTRTSPTRAARHLPMSQIAELLQREKPDLQTLWDLAHFWGNWPAELGRYRGWRSRFDWVPANMTCSKDTSAEVGESVDLTAHAAGPGLCLSIRHIHGAITLKPTIRSLR